MKLKVKKISILIFCLYSISCAGLGANTTKIKKTVTNEELSVQKSPTQSPTNEILSNDYAVAIAALNKAISEKDKNKIGLGLRSRFLMVKQKTVEAIKELNDKNFIPNLIEALQANQGIIEGGSETRISQENLNKEIIFVLKQLTGLEFPYLKDSSMSPCIDDCPSKEIEMVIKESQEWWEFNKEKIMSTR